MKITYLLISFIIIQVATFFNCALAQNVGIGIPNPTEKLDVGGNMNINGRLKIAGNAGKANEVLMTNPNGATQWAPVPSNTQFNNFFGFTYLITHTTTWTVPNSVNKIQVEAWGAGGGGSEGGGGGGGGYVVAGFGVNPGTVISIVLGTGGTRTVGQPGGKGGETVVTVADTNGITWYVIAFGGQGAYINNPGSEFRSSYNDGGYYAVANQFPITPSVQLYTNFTGIWGQGGFPCYFTYTQTASTTFLQEMTGGKGGDAGNSYSTGGGGSRSFYNSNPYFQSAYGPGMGHEGGGGGGGIAAAVVNFPGQTGGAGKVIIRY